MPKRIQLSREKGWRLPANAVKVDRTTNYGNPYVIGDKMDMKMVRRWGWNGDIILYVPSPERYIDDLIGG